MRQIARLTPEQVDSALNGLSGWSVVEGKLRREYKFSDFTHAFGFMAAAATVIEKMDHHPEWFNVYGRVTVELWTHTEGGITQLDVDLARKLDAIAHKLS